MSEPKEKSNALESAILFQCTWKDFDTARCRRYQHNEAASEEKDDFQERPRPCGGQPLGWRNVDHRCLHYDVAVANFQRAWRNGRRSGLKQA
jgi:hypothetical protein